MSQKRARRTVAPEENAAILRQHLVDKMAPSDLSEEYRIQSGSFCVWLRQAPGASAKRSRTATAETTHIVPGGRPPEADQILEEMVKMREAKLSRKDQMIAEISAGCVQLKNNLGSPERPMRPSGYA